jgi:hypothetical protein
MNVMIPWGVGMVSVAMSGTMTKMTMTPTCKTVENRKLVMDLPTGLPSPEDSTRNVIISLGTAFCAPFLTGGSS